MPGWKRSDPTVAERFDKALPDDPLVERKQMFGYPACFVNGNYFAGLHEDNVVLRLPGIKDRVSALSAAAVFDPLRTGKGMKDWWVVPADVAADPARLASLLRETLAGVAGLPPKVKKARKKKAAAG
jgi:hypothetical protein